MIEIINNAEDKNEASVVEERGMFNSWYMYPITFEKKAYTLKFKSTNAVNVYNYDSRKKHHKGKYKFSFTLTQQDMCSPKLLQQTLFVEFSREYERIISKLAERNNRYLIAGWDGVLR